MSYESSIPCDSSTVTTPLLPTFSTASAMIEPSTSDSAEMEATCFISALPETGFAIFLSSASAICFAFSMPLRIIIAFAPFITRDSPSSTSASRSTTEVVVPSPAVSFVLFATSFTISAPIFSNLSFNEISFAIETPSFVMRGPPYDFSITTLRPFGPRVIFTACAACAIPFAIALRASSEKRICFAILVFNKDNVGFRQHIIFNPLNFNRLIPRLFEENRVARLHFNRNALPFVVFATRTNGDDLALQELLFVYGFGNDNAGGELLLALLFGGLDHNAVPERL